MKKKNKSLISSGKKCEICGKIKSDVKPRKLYDYINCEYDVIECCSECERKFWEDL